MQTASATASTGSSTSSAGSRIFSTMATTSPARTVIRRRAIIHRTRSTRMRGSLRGTSGKASVGPAAAAGGGAGSPRKCRAPRRGGRRGARHTADRDVTCVTRALRVPCRQPAGQPAELVAPTLPEEGAGLAGAPDAARLAYQPGRRIAQHGGAQERELVDQRRHLRVCKEGRRHGLGGQVARTAFALALGLLARPRDRRPLVVSEDGADAAQPRRGGR